MNIGTGVSIIKVMDHCQYQRVSGSAFGGGTYWGLCQLLTGCTTWDEAMELLTDDNTSADAVNLLVKDIFGGDHHFPSGAVLPGHLTASFFGKVRGGTTPDKGSVLMALTIMMAQTICQVSYLNARIHQTDKVIFTGNYLRKNPVAQAQIATSFERANIANLGHVLVNSWQKFSPNFASF